MNTILEIDPAYRAALRAAKLADFDAMMAVRGGPPTSKHAHRETLPLQISVDGRMRTFFLKRVFKVPPKHAFWPMLRLDKAFSQPAREWQTCQSLESVGIPAMKAVAFGERRSLAMPTAAFLLVEAVPMPHTLENWLVPGFPRPAPVSTRLSERLIHELGSLVRRIHDAGFDWPDIHAKHIYAAPRQAPDRGQSWRFCLIDVERMTVVRASRPCLPTPSSPLQNPAGLSKLLRKLLSSLSPMQFDRRDALCLLAGASSADAVGGQSAPADELIERAGLDGLLRSFPIRNMPRLPDDYQHPRCVPLAMHNGMVVDQRMVHWLQAAGLSRFDDVFSYSAGKKMTKPGLAPYRDRLRVQATDDRGRTKVFYLKRYRRPPLSNQLRRICECGFKSSTGRREMRYIKELSLLGIPTMRGVAFGQRMRGPLEERSFGITEEVPGESLETLTNPKSPIPNRQSSIANRQSPFPPPWAERKEIIRLLAVITRCLHRNGLFHRDLYLSHVFLSRNADGAIVLRLIDLARMIKNPLRPGRWRVKDLAALNHSAPASLVTRADRLRFLYHYHENQNAERTCRRGSDAVHRQRLRIMARLVMARTRRMARHDAQRAKRHQKRVKSEEKD